ncbi:MAG: carboxypeptidase-like regulatory domain-containing protein [Bacteroidetes bacterium]|nr:carboxypeptidase-like regulatory domain-containing protein [Bacteroidota bacterium]
MKKLLTLLTIAMFCAMTVFADGEKNSGITEVSGKVVDQNTGELLAGVKIEIRETGQVLFSDLDGNFDFQLPANQEYTVVLSLVSYKQTTAVLNVSPEATFGLSLVLKQ